jgi:hypothetical protein
VELEVQDNTQRSTSSRNGSQHSHLTENSSADKVPLLAASLVEDAPEQIDTTGATRGPTKQNWTQ